MTATVEYRARVIWEGNRGKGTADYASYGRGYRVLIADKPDLLGSANVAFRGERERHDPEDLFLTAVAACHMLAYLALCARNGVRVIEYEDAPRGQLVHDASGGGRFSEIVLRPVVTIGDAGHEQAAFALHETAHARCFIANSCSAPIRCNPTVRVVPNISVERSA
jgi:organic hydroperoxide reductase OsmC/OhrA